MAAITARKKGTRVIYTAHGFHFFKGAPITNWLIFYPIEKVLSRFTDTLITINKEDYELAKSKFKTNVQYVPGVGIDPKKFDFKMTKRQKTELRQSIGLNDDDFVMIYPAELNKNKNQLWLINSLAELIKNNHAMHLLLPGKDSQSGKCQDLVGKLNLNNNIHFLGFRKDIPHLLKISDLSVSSSLREGLPVNIMEAMQAGIPVITTSCRGSRDLVQDNSNGFIVLINDHKTLVNKVEFIFNNVNIRNKMAANGKLVVQDYRLDKVLPLMKDIYEATNVTKDNAPIRILQIVTIMNRGGLETMLMNYYRNIDRNKIQFDFIVHRSEKGAYDDEILSLGGNIYHFSPISFKNLIRYQKDLSTFLRNNPQYKIVHSHLDSLSALPLAIAKRAGVPVRIAHSHNASFDKNLKAKIRNSAKGLIKYTATDMIGCSNEAANFMFGKNAKGYKVINNAIDVEKFRYNPKKRAEVRDSLKISKNCLVIGHVGRFDYQKNHEFLIEIFNEIYRKNKNSVLLLVGNGNGMADIEYRVKELGLKNAVRFLGSRSDIPDLMQAMDVFVMPSRFEGLPVVSIEAQASGLRTYFSDVVTHDVAVTKDCHFISLDYKAAYWANQVLQSPLTPREDTKSRIIDMGFDVVSEVGNLANYYKVKYESQK